MSWKIFNILKKNKDKMSNIDTLMSLKNSYQGVTFQWVKPLKNTPNVLGTVVTVTDIKSKLLPNRKYAYDAVLSDGISISIEDLNSNLMMIHGEQSPLTKDEIYSINIGAGLDVAQLKESLPNDLQNYSTLLNTPTPEIDYTQTPADQSIIAVESSQEEDNDMVDVTDLFGMFTLDDTNLNLTVNIKLPAKNLLRMMYNNSQDQDEFISKLSAYINKNITLDAINLAVRRFIGPTKK